MKEAHIRGFSFFCTACGYIDLFFSSNRKFELS